MMQTIQNHLPDFIQALSLIISLAAMIAAFTPTPTDNAALAVLRKVVDFLAMNWGHAANAEKAAKYDAEHAASPQSAGGQASAARTGERAERIDRPL